MQNWPESQPAPHKTLARGRRSGYTAGMLDPEVTKHHERLLIIDFGSQVTQLIARRLRELNV